MAILKMLWKFTKFTLLAIILLLVVFVTWFYFAVRIEEPEITDTSVNSLERTKVSEEFYTIDGDWLKKSESGHWEMYITGNGYERGVKEGKLHKELAEFQEQAFVDQIKKMVPSKSTLNYLKYFIAFFNRNIDEHIPKEYLDEIYGESLSASDKFDFIAPKYHRLINYHAAHDIGHAIKDKNMNVGCTSFGAWGKKTKDGKLLIARNFDFYVGEEFAKNKIINFVNPSKGHKFMMVSWAGMIGVVSGMNVEGLTVTINASKSEIPTSAATPISILAREILQYASTIEEAYAIARQRKVFVSESILIGSAKDKKTALIEVTPSQTHLVLPEGNTQLCANHFQSNAFEKDENHMENIAKSASPYRFKRLKELMNKDTLTAIRAVEILRDKDGLEGKNIGLGNEKALNQLIAHHGVVFSPEDLKVWVSTSNYNLGAFTCYDLNQVFSIADTLNANKEITTSPTIAQDSIVNNGVLENYLTYLELEETLKNGDGTKEDIKKFQSLNPEYYETYWVVGNWFRDKGETLLAISQYEIALEKEIASLYEREEIEAEIKKLETP